MKKDELIEWMQEYLNDNRTFPEFEMNEAMDELSAFFCRTAKRLKIAYQLQKENSQYENDFLMAFRDFLLVFETSMELKTVEIPELNEYAIKKDDVTGEFFSTFQFPEGVISELAEQAFMRNYILEEKRKEEYNLMTDSLIYSVTGFKYFKSMAQKLSVYGALNTPAGYTTLIALPTGGGKSLITQMVAYQSEGLTIVVVPTISLADDQLIAARQIIKRDSIAQEIFAYKSGSSITPILEAIQKRTARLLYISPESLMNNQAFDEVIRTANKQRYVRNIIIDEAHIVVDWGASFRVDYQCLESWRKKLIFSNPEIRTILLSATFENKCVAVLKKLFSDGERWIEIRCDALRHEPRYMLLKEKSYKDKDRKTIELVQKLPHPMIIYVAKPDDAERVKRLIENEGINNVRTYTGLTKNREREQTLREWKGDQFEIMIATSAFGVGVDKPDVRTVLHLYVPQNPNVYYQELGRGGRDRLPCLSVMCICMDDDVKIAFDRIKQRVMTTKKIIGRWNSMYNNKSSRRNGAIIQINTAIRPNYYEKDEWDDVPISDADMNWNIYVLLLFRRYDLINIVEIVNDKGIYTFEIEIENDLLLTKGEEQTELIDQIRTEEWNYYYNAYRIIKNAVKENGRVCWSEMFFDTYDKVYEYCAGCNEHYFVNDGDEHTFPLKRNIREPVKEVYPDQKRIFEYQDELVIFAKGKKKADVIRYLDQQRLTCLVATDQQLEEIGYFDFTQSLKSTYIVNPAGVRELLKSGNYYYISGIVGILYPENEEEVFKWYKIAVSYLCHKEGIHVVHILSENVFFSSIGKKMTDLVEGRVVSADTLRY